MLNDVRNCSGNLSGPRDGGARNSKSFLEPDQAFALLDAAESIDLEFGLLCYTLLYTGRRIGEARVLRAFLSLMAFANRQIETERDGPASH